MSSGLTSGSDESECKITAFLGYTQIKMLFFVQMYALIDIGGAVFVYIERNTSLMRSGVFIQLFLELEVGIAYLGDRHMELLRSVEWRTVLHLQERGQVILGHLLVAIVDVLLHEEIHELLNRQREVGIIVLANQFHTARPFERRSLVGQEGQDII